MTPDEKAMHEQKRNKRAETVLGIITEGPDVDPGTAIDVFTILTAATLASLEYLSLSDIDRLVEENAQKITDLARHFRKEKGKVFQ
jgi:hypothetical protein